MKKSRYTRYFKYPLDCLIAAFLILLTSPVLLSTILLLAIANRGSGIFFLQERPGKNGKIFRIIKFKTMNDRKDCRGNFLPDSLRMTPIGKIVRATIIRKSKNPAKPKRKVQNPTKIGRNHNSKRLSKYESRNIEKVEKEHQKLSKPDALFSYVNHATLYNIMSV